MKPKMTQTAAKQNIEDLARAIADLTSIMQEQFDIAHQQFGAMDKKFETKFAAVNKRFDAIDRDLLAIKNEQAHAATRLSNLERQGEHRDQNAVSIGHQITRLYKWTHQIADHVGYELRL